MSRTISPTMNIEWNPIPLRKGMENWESHKADNYGQVKFPPAAIPGYLTIPGLYLLPEAVEPEVGTGELQVYVVCKDSNQYKDITEHCTVFFINNRYYLKVPLIPLDNTMNFDSDVVYLTFPDIDAYSDDQLFCKDLVSEPWQISFTYDQLVSGGDSSFGLENANPVVIRWWDDNDFVMGTYGNQTVVLPYSTADFEFGLAIPTQLSKPEYSRIEEGTDRDGLFFAERRVLTKTYHIRFAAPEYVLDAIRFAEIADYVEISQGDKVFAVDNIEFDVEWLDDGSVANVDCKFTTTSVIRKLANYITG